MNIFQNRPELGDVESPRSTEINPKITALDLPSKRQTLQIEKPRRALKIGQRVGIGFNEPLELGPRRELPFQHFQKSNIMALENTKEGCNVAAVIVDDF